MIKRRIELYTLLEKWNSIKEDLLLQKLWQAERELKQILIQKNIRENELKKLINELEQSKTINAYELKEKLKLKETLKKEIKEYTQAEQKKVLEINQFKNQIKKFHTQKKLYQNLKEKLISSYNMELNKQFLKELDDIAITQKTRALINEN